MTPCLDSGQHISVSSAYDTGPPLFSLEVRSVRGLELIN